jgi:lipid A 4'-phosphatase
MSYLKSRRSWTILGCFLATSMLFNAFPGIDIYVSRLFYDGDFPLRDPTWQAFQQRALGTLLCLALFVVVAVYLFNRLRQRNILRIDGRKVCYLFLVLILGAGAIVNAGLKDNFGRVRPRDVVEFGGDRQFTPAFVIGRECRKNCSFSSGDAAAGFFSLAFALALSRRRSAFVAAVAIGALVSLSRIAAGAHFLSDTVVSFFVMLLVADLLHHHIVLTPFERGALPVREPLFAKVLLHPPPVK